MDIFREPLHGLLGGSPLLGCPGERGCADGGKSFAENIAPFSERLALARDGEIHFPRTMAVLAGEIVAAARGLEPFRARLDGVVERRKHPGGAALEPDAFIGVEE